MKPYIRILSILAIAWLLLTLINKVYEKGHEKYFSHQTEKFNTLLKNKDAYYDVLLIGSSRMHVHYNPKVIDSVAHLSSYNFGVEGGNLLETNLWLQAYLQIHPKPKAVLLDLTSFAFDIERRPFFNPTIYFPYLNNDIIFNTLSRYKKIGLYKYMPFLKFLEIDDYNKSIAFQGLFGKKEDQALNYTYNGFAENNHILRPSENPPRDTNTFKITESGKKILNTIIDTCYKKNIKLILAFSPYYNDIYVSRKASFFAYVKQVSEKYQLPFLDYRDSYISKDSTCFGEWAHLNRRGSTIFSADIAGKIVTELSK